MDHATPTSPLGERLDALEARQAALREELDGLVAEVRAALEGAK
jgi:hypothetical protein